MQNIQIYTDGSCHTQLCIGSWVAIIIIDNTKVILSAIVENTTHNRMELTAVIKALSYVLENGHQGCRVTVITDSQYVMGLTPRGDKLSANNFITKKGNTIRNADLVQELLALNRDINIEYVKIKAHQKKGIENNFNVDADQLSRQMVRQRVSKLTK